MAFTTEAKYYNKFHKDKDYQKQAEHLREIYPDAKYVLEVGCGTGLMTRELQKQGFKVIGIEPNKEMLKMWRAKSTKVIQKKIESVGFCEFLPKQFDLVLALYDVLNYVPHDWYGEVMYNLRSWGKKLIYEDWRGNKVDLVRVKKVNGIIRLRIAIKHNQKVSIWYIYLAKKPIIEKHTLYLHNA
jgi:SAM-dependent methyltransferase